jgi:PAS domain S-box-containing protein
MKHLKHYFLLLPSGYKLSLIVGIFVIITLCILLLANMSFSILSSVRAYTTGEGLWSKAQKDAVYHLVRYANSHDVAEHENFLEAITVPLGDHQARLELEKPDPDLDLVYEGFMLGGNHPDDVAGMATLFRRFRYERHLSEAIKIWAAGDKLIFELIDLGEQLHTEIESETPDEARIAQLLSEIDRVNEELRPLEDRFSQVLGEGARWMHGTLVVVLTVVTALLLSLGCLLAWWLLYHVQAAQEKYRHLFETANDAILLADAQTGIILDANPKAEELWGMSRLNLLGLHQTDLHPDQGQQRYQARFAQAAQGERLEVEDMYIKRADHSRVPVVISASLSQLNGQRVVQGIFHDISERKQIEENLRHTQKLQSLGAMAAGLAHDFNNMLSTILIRNELALRQIKTGQPDAQNIEKTLVVTQQAIDLTGKMLAYSGQGHFQLQRVGLNQVITDYLPLLTTAVAHRATLTWQLAPHLPVIEADLAQLHQLLLNLVVNGAEAIEEAGHQGSVSIVTSRCQLTEAETVANATGEKLPSGDYVQVIIEDDGVGMDEETADHIFDPFYSKKFIGRGLGLPVVLGIMRGHKGGIQVISSPGAGTTVTLYFPCREEEP